jgi:hypothetical protein
LLDEEVRNYQESGMTMAHGYQQVEDALAENPDLTLAQIKRWLAEQYGLLVSEVDQSFRRLRNVYDQARREALNARQAKVELVRREDGGIGWEPTRHLRAGKLVTDPQTDELEKPTNEKVYYYHYRQGKKSMSVCIAHRQNGQAAFQELDSGTNPRGLP